MLGTLRRHALAASIACVLSSSAMAATVFLEDFQDYVHPTTGETVLRCSGAASPGGPGTYPFPDNWLLRNVDNRTPATSVNYVNQAWRVREDFSFNVLNCAAFSTSWYSPAGAANDWMWTPAIGPLPAESKLSWRGLTYDSAYQDGYEVRIMTAPDAPTGGTGAIGNQITNSTVLFSTPAENSSWTSREVPLTAYTGQTVYIGFRNNAVDKFLLLIDDIKVESPDANLAAAASSGYASPYARLPSGFSVDANLQVVASNPGTVTQTNVGATAQILVDGVPVGSPLTASSTVPTIAAGASAPILFTDPAALSGSGVWSVDYTVTSDQSAQDIDPSDDTVSVAIASVGGRELARFQGEPTGTLGIGAENGGELGTTFSLAHAATFEGVRFALGPVQENTPPEPPSTWPGKSVTANLRAADATGKPGALIASTEAIITTMEGGTYDVKFVDGLQALEAGNYFVGVVEPTGTESTLPLYNGPNRFVTNTNWVNWPTIPTGDWAPVESFGPSFARTFYVSLLTESSLFADGFDEEVEPEAGRAATRDATYRTGGVRKGVAVPASP